MGSKKSVIPKTPEPTFKDAPRPRHPTDWHGETALRLRRLYFNRIKDDCLRETVIGIPWETWAALSEERSSNLEHIHRMTRVGLPSPEALPMSHEQYTSDHQTGVDFKNKNYDDAIPVYGRGDLPGGTIWFWFYPRS